VLLDGRRGSCHGRQVDWTLEVVLVPVSDVDRALRFYRDQLGFVLDHDTQTPDARIVQLTPPGSGCSIVLGDLPAHRAMTPGSLHGLQLVVADAEQAHAVLTARGVDAGPVEVLDLRDGGTLFSFADPDGNTWVVQQLRVRAERPLLGG
jgi:catechol 2,3-dioxygenase-like lactoylglutathione lyase family enzyme